MDLKQIEKLMTSMVRHGLTRFVLKKEGFELELEHSNAHFVGQEFSSEKVLSNFSSEKAAFLPSVSSTPTNVITNNDAIQRNNQESRGIFICSPMVGTFYTTPSPDQLPYIKVGDHVTEETVVCIIEAMKVMNEVKAGLTGIISEILVTSGDPVQFGTKLFRIQEKG